MLRGHGVLLATSLSICFGLSYLASLANLAPIIGAFAAGLILKPVHYKDLSSRNSDAEIRDLVAPITALLVPLFFVGMGAKVDISVFGNIQILHYAFWLTVVAIIGKQICSFGVVGEKLDKLSIGLGMIPRGEVGLIFVGIGAGLMIEGVPVINSETFGAIIIMVIITTMVTPPLLKWRLTSNN